jgi:hypothetical protein
MVVSGCGRSDRREIPTASHKSKGKGMGPDTGALLQSLLMTFTTVISPANVQMLRGFWVLPCCDLEQARF